MNNQKSGYTLLEISVAFACLSLIAVPVAGMLISSVRSHQGAQGWVETQRFTEDFTQQLNKDFRLASGIEKAEPSELTLRVSGHYVHYAVGDTMTRLETTLSGETVNQTGYKVSGGQFNYLYANEGSHDAKNVVSVTLTGLKVGGNEYQVSLPVFALNRYALASISTPTPSPSPSQFGYTLIVDKDLLFDGCNNLKVNGNIRANRNVTFNCCNDPSVPGICEAFKDVIITSCNNPRIANPVSKAKPKVDAPSLPTEGMVPPQPTKTVSANYTSLNSLNLGGSIYVDNNLSITSCNDIVNTGTIFASGNISFNSCNSISLSAAGQGMPCLYTPSGNISFQSCNFNQPTTIVGDIYAPRGNVNFQSCNGFKIIGNIYAPSGSVTFQSCGGQNSIQGGIYTKKSIGFASCNDFTIRDYLYAFANENGNGKGTVSFTDCGGRCSIGGLATFDATFARTNDLTLGH